MPSWPCVARGSGGALRCATAERHLQIGARPRSRAVASSSNAGRRCTSGAHSLSPFGAHVYPETGNGGYTSLHSDVFLDYDAVQNMFLPGTHVSLTDRATQCLTDFSLDFERTSPNATDGPDMTVQSVLVNGRPASFEFEQPTYPGDPNGQDDPDPRAHEASQNNPVGGPDDNPLPPACSPELTSTRSSQQDSLDGTQCPANKLVITPEHPIRRGQPFVVQVSYAGRPGVHNDGDGTTEGWFRNAQPGDEGSFVTTEPVGTEDWMPLNDHPSAKPSYDFYDTVTFGKTAIANGELVSQHNHGPSADFPGGSTTWHWHSPEAIAAYLVENSIGSFDLSERLASERDPVLRGAGQRDRPRPSRHEQDDHGHAGGHRRVPEHVQRPVPVHHRRGRRRRPLRQLRGGDADQDHVRRRTHRAPTFNHENMHQWWGDNVSEGNYNLTFFKEGMATLGEYLFEARNAQTAAGGPGTAAGDAAFETSLIDTFNSEYANTGSLWTAAPSNPRPFTLFSGSTTYTRPGIAYIALRQILGPDRFRQGAAAHSANYRQRSITEPQLEAGFAAFLPKRSPRLPGRARQFFTQWFDTAYPTGGGANRPQITGPGARRRRLSVPVMMRGSAGTANPKGEVARTTSLVPGPLTVRRRRDRSHYGQAHEEPSESKARSGALSVGCRPGEQQPVADSQDHVVEAFVLVHSAGEVQDAVGRIVVGGGREGGAVEEQVVGDDDPARGELGQHEVEVLRVVGLPGVDPHEVERSR